MLLHCCAFPLLSNLYTHPVLPKHPTVSAERSPCPRHQERSRLPHPRPPPRLPQPVPDPILFSGARSRRCRVRARRKPCHEERQHYARAAPEAGCALPRDRQLCGASRRHCRGCPAERGEQGFAGHVWHSEQWHNQRHTDPVAPSVSRASHRPAEHRANGGALAIAVKFHPHLLDAHDEGVAQRPGLFGHGVRQVQHAGWPRRHGRHYEWRGYVAAMVVVPDLALLCLYFYLECKRITYSAVVRLSQYAISLASLCIYTYIYT